MDKQEKTKKCIWVYYYMQSQYAICFAFAKVLQKQYSLTPRTLRN